MLHLTQRHTGQPLLPTGEINPCPDPSGTCLIATNIHSGVSPTASSEARLASGLVGGSFVGGTAGFRGIGVYGLGRGYNGVYGIGGFTVVGGVAAGNGVEGMTHSVDPRHGRRQRVGPHRSHGCRNVRWWAAAQLAAVAPTDSGWSRSVRVV
jgi:hypothetical protein